MRIELPLEYQQGLFRRFMTYVRIDTTSSSKSTSSPSTPGQLKLAELLREELLTLGLADVFKDEFGYVYATLLANFEGEHPVPPLGLMSHLDTSEQAPGDNVAPYVIHDYDCTDIELPDNSTISLTDNLALLKCRNHTLITTAGNTLLGADDKAGIAIIMTVLDYLLHHDDFKHGEIRVCFNPDEEVSRGTERIDLARFAVPMALTVDGGEGGEIEDECFNAATATVTITGVDIHPGYAKDRMVNAMRVFARVMRHLPEKFRPENTSDREPYIHPYDMDKPGTAYEFGFKCFLRAFTEEGLALMEELLREACAKAEADMPGSKVMVEVKQAYRNMKTKLDEHPEIMATLLAACETQGVAPIRKAIRGGTDGSTLTIAHNIPTPNIWDGGMNFHSRHEWLSVNWMRSSAETVLQFINLWLARHLP